MPIKRTEFYNKRKEHLSSYGLTGNIMNSISLFVFNMAFEENESPITVFNEWVKATGVAMESPEMLAGTIEFIRRLQKVDRKDLEQAVKKYKK